MLRSNTYRAAVIALVFLMVMGRHAEGLAADRTDAARISCEGWNTYVFFRRLRLRT